MNSAGAYASLEEEITRLLAMKNADGAMPSLRVRKKVINALIDSFITQTGKTPPGAQVQRLANWLLYETLINRHPDKVSREAYPIMTKRQLRTRYRRERASEYLQERYFKTGG